METITAYAQDMSEFLRASELTQRRAFIETFVKEIVIMPKKAVVRYTVPMPDDCRISGQSVENMTLDGSVLSIVKSGPPRRTRTTRRSECADSSGHCRQSASFLVFASLKTHWINPFINVVMAYS